MKYAYIYTHSMHKQALRTVCQLQMSLNTKTYFVLPEATNISLNTENSLYQLTQNLFWG